MSKRLPDRRVTRTRKLLHEALMRQVLERNYESITVQEILDRANVGRSTFYTHFQDKDELLKSGFQFLKNELRGNYTAAEGATKSYEDIVGFSLTTFEHADRFRRVIRALLRSRAASIVQQQIKSILVDQIRSEIEQMLHRRKHGSISIQPELLTNFLASTYLSLLIGWLNSKDPASPSEMDSTYRRFVLPCLTSIFG